MEGEDEAPPPTPAAGDGDGDPDGGDEGEGAEGGGKRLPRLTVKLSYCQVYNEKAYDLLDDDASAELGGGIESLPRVSLFEDDEGRVHLKGLSMKA